MHERAHLHAHTRVPSVHIHILCQTCSHVHTPQLTCHTTVLSVTLAHGSIHSLYACEGTFTRRVPGEYPCTRYTRAQCHQRATSHRGLVGGQGVPPAPSAAPTDHMTPGLRGLPRTCARSPPRRRGQGRGCNVGTRERQLLAGGLGPEESSGPGALRWAQGAIGGGGGAGRQASLVAVLGPRGGGW